jgi:beta-mannosidase
VTVSASVIVESWLNADYSIQLITWSRRMEKTTLTGQAQVVDQTGAAQIVVADPQLWWPNGYGQQPLNQVTVELRQGEQVLDQKEYKLGQRTIELLQEPDEWDALCFRGQRFSRSLPRGPTGFRPIPSPPVTSTNTWKG